VGLACEAEHGVVELLGQVVAAAAAVAAAVQLPPGHPQAPPIGGERRSVSLQDLSLEPAMFFKEKQNIERFNQHFLKRKNEKIK
jgi:hypothetical protein